jgi:hypothetical protein
MENKIAIILPLLGLAIMTWASFYWRRKFLEAEADSERHARNAANLYGALNDCRIEIKDTAFKLERARNRIAKLEGDRDKQNAFQKKVDALTAASDVPIVQFDSKAGRWHIR